VKRLLFLSLFLGCGGSGVTIDVALDLPTKDVLSPYHPSARLAYVRVTADGAERLDDVAKDIDLAARSVTFESYPVSRLTRVQVQGYDALGTLVAFGQLDAQVDTDDLSLTIPFRRTLAYVTHRDICDGGCAEGLVCANPGDGHRCVTPAATGACGASCNAREQEVCALPAPMSGPACMRPYGGGARGAHVIYAIDVSSKTLVDVIDLPAADQTAVNITAKGGAGVWVTLASPGKSSAAFLSSATNTFAPSVDLPNGIEYVLGSPDTKYVAGGGGGNLYVFDETTGAEARKVPLGGRILDGVIGGGGSKALFVTSAGLAQMDLEAPQEADPNSPGDVVGASGVATSDDGRFAYVTSGADGRVFVFDLVAGGSLLFENRFLATVRNMVFSAHAQIVLGIQVNAPSQRVFAYSIDDRSGFPVDRGISILPEARGIASGALGRRVVIVSAGTSTGSSGLTVVDPVPDQEPTGSTVLYPRDPTDSYLEGTVMSFQRYRPDRVAILNGQ